LASLGIGLAGLIPLIMVIRRKFSKKEHNPVA
jgi:hypothetical protein